MFLHLSVILLKGGSLFRGVSFQGVSFQVSVHGVSVTDMPGTVVRILLECIIVIYVLTQIFVK